MKKFIGMLLLIVASTSVLQSSSIASEGSVYNFSWLDKDKEVYVLQNRKFRKNGQFYVGGTGGKALAGAFIDSYEGSLYGGYFFKEDWGLELSYTKASGSTNATYAGVNDQGSVAFYRKIDTSISAMLMWSPFYSKINTFNKIFYFDWLFGLGLTSVSTNDNRNEFKPTGDADHDVLTNESNQGLTWMSGLRFYISNSWSTRLDFKAIHLNADSATSSTETEKKWSHYYNFAVGLNYAF